jgi:hypothetical protein
VCALLDWTARPIQLPPLYGRVKKNDDEKSNAAFLVFRPLFLAVPRPAIDLLSSVFFSPIVVARRKHPGLSTFFLVLLDNKGRRIWVAISLFVT